MASHTVHPTHPKLVRSHNMNTRKHRPDSLVFRILSIHTQSSVLNQGSLHQRKCAVRGSQVSLPSFAKLHNDRMIVRVRKWQPRFVNSPCYCTGQYIITTGIVYSTTTHASTWSPFPIRGYFHHLHPRFTLHYSLPTPHAA